MKRQLDADGFDITDDVGGKGNRLPVIAVGVVSAAIITASVGMVALAGDDSEHVARAADATVVTALGHTVTGDRAAVDAALPLARAALDGSIDMPAGLPEGETDVIPARMLEAYRTAEATLASESPGCSLPWWILAGIGKVQSNHAAGGRVDAAGTTTVRIVGPRLDGTAVGGSVVSDSDKGALDGDLTFDRGVGPMLMLPGTWSAIGRDGDGDGTADVSDADDAALAVGTVLCSAHADLSTAEGLAAGLAQIDDTPTFASDVLPWAAHYRATVPSTTATATGATTGGTTTTAPSTSTPTQTGTTPTAAVPVAGPGFTTLPIDAPATTTPPPATTPAPSPTRRPSPPVTSPVQRSPRPTDTPTRTPVKPGTPTRTPVTPAPTSPTRIPTTPPPRRPVPSDPPPQVPSDPPSEDPIVPPREDPPAPPREDPPAPPRVDPPAPPPEEPGEPPREDPADPPREGPGDDDGKRKGKDDDRRGKKGKDDGRDKKGKGDDRRDKKGKKSEGDDDSPIVDD